MDSKGNEFLDIFNEEHTYLSHISQNNLYESETIPQEEPDNFFLFKQNLHRMINVFYQQNKTNWDNYHEELNVAFIKMKKYLAHFMINTKPFDSLITNTVLTVLKLALHTDAYHQLDRDEQIGFLMNIIGGKIEVEEINSMLLSQLKKSIQEIADTELAQKIYNKIYNYYGEEDTLQQTKLLLDKIIDQTFSTAKMNIWSIRRFMSQKVDSLTTYDCQIFLDIGFVNPWNHQDIDMIEQVKLIKVGASVRVILHEFSNYMRIISDKYDYLKRTPENILPESASLFEQSIIASNQLFQSPKNLLVMDLWKNSLYIDICFEETQLLINRREDIKLRPKTVCALQGPRLDTSEYYRQMKLQENK